MRRFSICLLSLLLCFTVAEGVYRIRHTWRVARALDGRDPQELITQDAQGELLYGFKKSHSGTTNSHGFRDRERTVAKPKDRFRVAAIGDSVTAQMTIAFEDLYATLLEKRLGAAFPGADIEVLNFGVSGYSTYQEVELLERSAMRFAPDVILWQFHDNDAADPVVDGANGDFGLYYQRPRSYFLQFLKRRVVHLRQRWSWRDPTAQALTGDLKLQLFYWERIGRAFHRVKQLADSEGIPVLVFLYPTWPRGNSWDAYPVQAREMRLRIAKRFHDLGFRVLDLQPGLQEHDPATFRMAPDDAWHPNAAGHAWMGRRIADWMISELSPNAFFPQGQ